MTEQFEILASLEAEQSVLGAILIDNDSANLLDKLNAKGFFQRQKRPDFQDRHVDDFRRSAGRCDYALMPNLASVD